MRRMASIGHARIWPDQAKTPALTVPILAQRHRRVGIDAELPAAAGDRDDRVLTKEINR
jgi:hypothetical protein